MNKFIIPSSLIIVIIIAAYWMCSRNSCFAMQKEAATKTNILFIQVTPNSTVLDALVALRKAIHPMINSIIKKEFGLATDLDVNFFHPKGYWQRLSVYSLRDVKTDGIDLIAKGMEEILQNKAKAFFVQNVAITPEMHFFGEHNDELVITIDDPDKELTNLNGIFKAAMHMVNDKYKAKHSTDLYDVTNSEKFSYAPHIGLGRLSSKIKQYIKDESHIDKVYARIKEQILRESIAMAKKILTADNGKITFTALCLLDPSIAHRLLAENVTLDEVSKRACIKEFPIQK